MGNRNSGRRPQPTALKVLRGNPGQRALNEAEPKPPVGEVVRPEFLSEMAAAVWGEVAPVVIAMGTLTPADVQSFATYCELEATRRTASLAKDGRKLITLRADDDENGRLEIVIDNILKLERDTANALRPYYEKFGLEPSGRSRIKLPKAAEPVNKWAAMGCA